MIEARLMWAATILSIAMVLLVVASPVFAAYEALAPPPAAEGEEATDTPPAIGDVTVGFPAPPGPAFTAGVLMQLRGDAWVLYTDDVVELCGREGGCVRFAPDGFCTMVIDRLLAPLASGVVERHLLARCAGWVP